MISPAIRYTLARITIFFACLLLGWLAGLRNNPLVLLLVATTVSMFISLFVLRSMREQFAEQVADKVEHRTAQKQAKAARRRSDEVLEDDELDGTDAQAATHQAETHAPPQTSQEHPQR